MVAVAPIDEALASRSRALAEAIAQQAATAEILRVISRSPSDAQPVFDTIATAALKLCGARSANVLSYDGTRLRVAAMAIVDPRGVEAMGSLFPRPASHDSAAGRAVLTCSVVVIADVLADPDYMSRQAAVVAGFRSILAVPLLRAGEPIGAIAVGRAEPGPFPVSQLDLLQTFAEQAVIAIENMRLFKEREQRHRDLSEALDHQQATSEILRILSRIPNDVQPVFEAIVNSGVRLFPDAAVAVSRHDGSQVRSVAIAEHDPERAARWRKVFPFPLSREYIHGAAILDCRVVDVPDVLVAGGQFEAGKRNLAPSGYRAMTVVPLIRDGAAIGAIAVVRMQPGALSAKQIGLLQTFADQAVIAIENVRLFKELQARTAQLTQSVEQLRALSEVGQAVSSTLEIETVLRTIVSRATQLSGMDGGAIYEYDAAGESFRLHTTDRLPAPLVAALAATPMSKGDGAIGRLASTREPVAIADILVEGVYQSRVRDLLVALGYRSLLAVPLLYENRLLGGLVVNRKQAGEFEPRVVELLKTFATQSALAIQNARLFREIEDKSRQLEVASRHKSAFLANMSHELRTPLNAIIGFTRIVLRRTGEQIEARQVQNLENILASAQHLLSLINAALDLAKVEAGRVEIHATEVALAPLLDHCMRTVEPLLDEQVVLGLQAVDDLPPMRVDEEKLRQIVINLLSNAAKFTARGRIDVQARVDAGQVEIAVADTGIGIPADKLEAVFEEFEQVDASSTRAHGGTGLGLAIARRLARLMGGELRAQAVLGAGSTFTLSLPLRYGSEAA